MSPSRDLYRAGAPAKFEGCYFWPKDVRVVRTAARDAAPVSAFHIGVRVFPNFHRVSPQPRAMPFTCWFNPAFADDSRWGRFHFATVAQACNRAVATGSARVRVTPPYPAAFA